MPCKTPLMTKDEAQILKSIGIVSLFAACACTTVIYLDKMQRTQPAQITQQTATADAHATPLTTPHPL